ncbi:MAG: hypothetical protein KF734_00595 [Saprospiraceae bacterium]|nr:hypothetical protein [Saprospiraceae bacterium]
MTTTLEKTLTVREFLELNIFEPGYCYELINGEIVLAFLGEEGGEVESKLLAGFKVKVDEVFA